MLCHEGRFTIVAQKAGRDGHCSTGVEYVDYRLTIMRRDFDGRVRPARGRPADQERQLETLTLHLAGNVDHLVERRSDQPTESDHIRLFRLGTFEDLFARDHYPHVDHLVVIAGEDDTDDVLANVVNVAFDRRQYDLSLGLDHFASRRPGFLLGFHERRQVRHGLLHHTGRFHHLGQEHFAGPEQIAHDTHAGHQWAFDHQ